MDFSKEIINFISKQIGGVVIIASGSSEIVYADRFLFDRYGSDIVGQDADEVLGWMSSCPKLEADGESLEWESIDTDSKKYYRINSACFNKNDKSYYIHQITDITEYMGLNRDITKYMSFFKKLSKFQTKVLENLSDTYYEMLPMLVDYFKTSKAYFFLERDGHMEITTYSKMGNLYSTYRISMSEASAKVFFIDTLNDIHNEDLSMDIQQVLTEDSTVQDGAYRFLCNGDVSGQRYAVFLNVWPNMDSEYMSDKTLLSVIKLYAENSIMREKLIYETEHDHLTGLYNKGKYLSMAEGEYPSKASIAVFNFDVNNLKKLNDSMGHEAGDRLIVKAADSIRRVTARNIHGYRMGGDEFLMVACDISESEVADLKTKWENELARLNTMDDDINCVMAVGVSYGIGERFEELCKKADEFMYEDKRKKKNGEQIR